MNKDGKWRFIRAGEVAGPRLAAPGTRGRTSTGASPGPGGGLGLPGSPSRIGAGLTGPFVGVASTSEEKSLRIMNGAESYDQWMFVAGRPRILGKPLVPMAPGLQPGMPGAPGATGAQAPPTKKN
jgi:hypothetical protein